MGGSDAATLLLSLLALGVGALAVYGDARGPRQLYYVTKPLATSLILVVAILRCPLRPAVGLWIIIGLGCALAGDVLLMLPRDRFVAGLTCFLLAQGAYICAFTSESALLGPLWALAPSLLLLALLGLAVLPRAGAMRAPVAIYGLVIATMAWRALTRHLALDATHTLLGVLGAWLFVASDLSLAWGRFVRRAAWLPIFCLSSYYLAQILIALSI